MFLQFIPISVCLLLLAVLSAYLILKVRWKYVLKFILIPAVFAVTLMGISLLDDVLGIANPQYPEKQFVLLFYTQRLTNDNTRMIDFLVREKEGNRFYTIPYSKDVEDQMKKMIQDGKKGQISIAKFKVKKHGVSQGSGLDDVTLQQQQSTVSQWISKDR